MDPLDSSRNSGLIGLDKAPAGPFDNGNLSNDFLLLPTEHESGLSDRIEEDEDGSTALSSELVLE